MLKVFRFGGHQDPDDERNRLVFDFARLVRQLEPKYFVMENVKGMMSVVTQGPSSIRSSDEFKTSRIRDCGANLCISILKIMELQPADVGVLSSWGIVKFGPDEVPRTKGLPRPQWQQFQPVVRDASADLPRSKITKAPDSRRHIRRRNLGRPVQRLRRTHAGSHTG